MLERNSIEIEFFGGPLDGYVDTFELETGSVDYVCVAVNRCFPQPGSPSGGSGSSPNISVYQRETRDGFDRYVFRKTARMSEIADEFGLDY